MAIKPSTAHRGFAGLEYPLTQISLAVTDLDATMQHYHQAFGWAPWQVFDHVPPVHHATELRGAPVLYSLRGAEVYVGSMNFELLQPLEGPNLWSEHIESHGEGIASIATMFHEREEGDAVKEAFRELLGSEVTMKADIGDHIEYYYLDTQDEFGCLIESGSGHAIDFVKPANVFPHEGAKPEPSPASGLTYRLSQVSLVVRDVESKVRSFQTAFGWGPWRFFDNPVESAEVAGRPTEFGVQFAQAKIGDFNFEIVAPTSGSSPYADYLDQFGEGLAAIGVTVASSDEVAQAERQFESMGVSVAARGRIQNAPPWLILDSRRDFKTLIQISTGHAFDNGTPTRVIG